MSRTVRMTLALSMVLALVTATVGVAGLHAQESKATEPAKVDGLSFENWGEYFSSDYFRATGNRCGTPDRQTREFLNPAPVGVAPRGSSNGADCSASSTNPLAIYDPGVTYNIPVVVHVITNTSGTGNLTDMQVQSQIDILNEDFQALTGTPGASGTNIALHFFLATEDPVGNPTTGITRTANDTWWNDNGNYWDTLAWDPNTYMNIYSNNIGGGGILGYVPFLPADSGGAMVGQNSDRVVVLWNAFGRNAPLAPFNQGRTATHEVGHYLGMEHTFSGGCGTASAPGCYTTGDLVCDTNSEGSSNFGCPGNPTSCGTPDPYTNYMDYTDDTCMMEFTVEQARRIRCTIENWRPNLAQMGSTNEVFSDGFESGNTSVWTTTVSP